MRPLLLTLLLLPLLAADAHAIGWLFEYRVNIYRRPSQQPKKPPPGARKEVFYVNRLQHGEQGLYLNSRMKITRWVRGVGGRKVAKVNTTVVKPYLDGKEWDALRANKGDEAATAFGHLLGRHPKDPLLTIGYALATAEQGQLERATRAFRRAVTQGADIVAQVQLDAALRTRVQELAATFAAIEKPDRDEAFATAMLYFLLRDKKKAEATLKPHLRPRDTTAAELARLIDEIDLVPGK